MSFPSNDPSHVFRDFVTNGIPSSGAWKPRKPEIRGLLKEYESAIIALIGGQGGDIDLARGVIHFSVTGGTADAIIAEADADLPQNPGSAIFILGGIATDNTGPVTVNGKPLRTNSGNDIVPGGLVAGGIHVFIDLGDHYRLLSDQASAAIIAAAEVAAGIAINAASDAVAAQLVAESAAGANLSNADSRAAAIATNIPGPVNYVRTAGYASAGDGGGALYRRVVSEPAHAGKFQSADGTWWELADKQASVLSFGAVPDGLTPNQSALYASLTWALTTDGKVFVPFGAYNFTAETSVSSADGGSSLAMEFQDGALFKAYSLADATAILKCTGLTRIDIINPHALGTGPGMNGSGIGERAFYFDQCSNISIKGGRIEKIRREALYFLDCVRIRVEDLDVIESAYLQIGAIQGTGCDDVLVKGCFLDGSGQKGISFNRGSRVKIVNNTVINTVVGDAIFLGGVLHGDISHNIVNEVGGNGDGIKVSVGGNDQSIPSLYCSITGNKIRNCIGNSANIRLTGASYCVVSGNICYYGQENIRWGTNTPGTIHSIGNVIEGNICIEAKEHGIDAGDNSAVSIIRNNYVRRYGLDGSNRAGILIRSADSCSIIGNVIRNGGGGGSYGIRLLAGASNTLLGINDSYNGGQTADVLDQGSGTRTS